MDINWLRSLITVAAFAAFLGIVWWAYGPSRRQRFERDAMLPFEENHNEEAPERPSPHALLPSGEGKKRREMSTRPFPDGGNR